MEQEALPPASQDVIRRVRESLNLDENRIKEAVEGIQNWIKQQPHLPKVEDYGRLERWLITCKNSMEKTKQTLDVYYSLRTLIPELTCNWDVDDQWFRDACNQTYCIPMPTLTEDLDRIVIVGWVSDNHPDYNMLQGFKLVILVNEILKCEDYKRKDIHVFDLKNYNLSDISKISFPLIKKLEVCLFKGFNTRVRAIHFINSPPYAEMLVNFVKTILKSKLASRLHVHGTDLTKFHKHIPQHLLPEEHGGTAGTLQENWSKWQKKLKSYRTWFLERETIKADEDLRPSNTMDSGELFGFEGSFRKLTID